MVKNVPVKKRIKTQHSVDLVAGAFEYLNEHLSELKKADYGDITELCLYLLTGYRRDEINSTLFDMISSYIEENIGEMKLTLTDRNTVRQIKIGKIKMGSLRVKDFSLDEEKEKEEKGINTCGFYPTMDNKDRIFLTYHNNLIMGKASLSKDDCDNIVIGDYYLNRRTISKYNASLTKIEAASPGLLVTKIYQFNDIGITNLYEGLMTLEEGKTSNEYFVTMSEPKHEVLKFGIRQTNSTTSIRVK